MSTSTLIAGPSESRLAQIPVAQATRTHRPVPHHEIVEALVETLSFRHIGVVNEEYVVSADGMKMFGVLDLKTAIPRPASPLTRAASVFLEVCVCRAK